MAEVKKAYFHFKGKSFQSIVKFKKFTGPILDVTLTNSEFTGTACKKIDKKIIGNILEVRCTFWGYTGSPGTATLHYNVYTARQPVPSLDDLQDQVFNINVSGLSDEKFEKKFENIGGEIVHLEIIGQQNQNVSKVELKPMGAKGFILSGQIKDNSKNESLEDTFYILAQIKKT